jgi:hypothetical protein
VATSQALARCSTATVTTTASDYTLTAADTALTSACVKEGFTTQCLRLKEGGRRTERDTAGSAAICEQERGKGVLKVGGGLTVGLHLSAGEKKRKRGERVAGPVDRFGGRAGCAGPIFAGGCGTCQQL